MMTLDQLEQEANQLPSRERAELLLLIAESLRREKAPLPQPRDFTEEQLNAWMDEDEEAMRRFKAKK